MKETIVDGARASAETRDLWTGLPRSNVYKQKKLTGWREPDAERPDDFEIERRVCALETKRFSGLRAFQASTGRDAHTVMLGVYHVLLQWYLDDFESLIGCCVLSPSATWQPSYVYAEDDDPIEGLLRDVEQQQRTARIVGVDLADVASVTAQHAPVFFYAGVERLPDAPSDTPSDSLSESGLATAFQERRVIVASGTSAAQADLHVSMPGIVSRTIGIETFQSRYDRVLSALVTGDCTRIGEVKALLGDPSEVPYRQLDEMQRRVIALWAKVLGIDETSLSEDSNYFAVGGTSLNAFKLMNRVRVDLGRDISIWEIVENPTIQEFSRVLLTPA